MTAGDRTPRSWRSQLVAKEREGLDRSVFSEGVLEEQTEKKVWYTCDWNLEGKEEDRISSDCFGTWLEKKRQIRLILHIRDYIRPILGVVSACGWKKKETLLAVPKRWQIQYVWILGEKKLFCLFWVMCFVCYQNLVCVYGYIQLIWTLSVHEYVLSVLGDLLICFETAFWW
jgi:hypothetical protein